MTTRKRFKDKKEIVLPSTVSMTVTTLTTDITQHFYFQGAFTLWQLWHWRDTSTFANLPAGTWLVSTSRFSRRYLTLNYISSYQGSVWDGLVYILTIILFSFLYNFVKFFEFQTKYSPCAEVKSSPTHAVSCFIILVLIAPKNYTSD